MSDAASPPLVDIVVTTRENFPVLRETLASVAAQTFSNYTCSVIDDCSRDGTVSLVRSAFPWVRVLRASRRSGPSRNRNTAASGETAPFIAILDDDVVLAHDWLDEMVRFISSSPAIGAAGSQLRFLHRPDHLNSVGGVFTPEGLGEDLFFDAPISDVATLIGRPLRIVFPCSAAMIVRREAFEAVGGFDPTYFYMAEDFDLGLRLTLRGYGVVYNPRAVAYHKYHTTARRFGRGRVRYLYYRNSLRTVLKSFEPATVAKVGLTLLRRLRARLDSRDGLRHGYAFVKAVGWNLIHLRSAVKARAEIQRHRTTDDESVMAINARLVALRARVTGATASPPPPPVPRWWLLRRAWRAWASMRSEQRDSAAEGPRHVDNLIFQATNICNAACKQCFVLDQLNRSVNQNLSLTEIERFFSSLGRVRNIVLGGGEPFLRKDLDRLCVILARVSAPDCVTIPTNGGYPDIVFRQVKRILEGTRHTLKISLSIDGPPEMHNAIRKVPDLYARVQETYAKLMDLYDVFYPRLVLQVNSTVFRDNYDRFMDTYRLVRRDFPLAQFMFETIRGHYDAGRAEPITDGEYVDLVQRVRDVSGKSLGEVLALHELALETIRRRTQVVPCNGGANFVVVDFFGNLSPCEILPAFANIRDIDYDFTRVARDPRWKQVIEDIQNAKCHCTHMCFLASSLNEARRDGRVGVTTPLALHDIHR